jgi:hypothetical protein
VETEAVIERANAMWERLGNEFEKRAFKLVESNVATDRDRALDDAAAAEGCFWRSTGENDAIDLRKREP